MHLDLKEEVKVKATRSLPSVQYFKSVKASLIVSFQSLRTDQFDIFSSCVRNDLKATLKCLLCGSAENNKRHAAADKVFVSSSHFFSDFMGDSIYKSNIYVNNALKVKYSIHKYHKF